MAGQQVGCISVDENVNVKAFIDMLKDQKMEAENETVGDDGRKYIPIVKKG